MQNITIQNQLFKFSDGLTLAECEADIRTIDKMSDAMRGERLSRIKHNKLYKEKIGTWEEYCNSEWNWTPQHANQLISFAETYQLIKSETTVSVLPEHESQTRALNQLQPEQKTEVWAKAVEAANGQQPTAEQVKTVATANNLHFCPTCQKSWRHEEKSTLFNVIYFPTIEKGASQKTCPNCAATPGPAAQWLEKQKTQPESQLTTPMYCPSCNKPQEILTTWLTNENLIKRGLLQCEQCQKNFNLIAWQKEPNSNHTRFCYNCNHEQTLTDKSIEHNNEVQCSNCKHHSHAKGWKITPGESWRHCTSCHSIWRKNTLLDHKDYTPERNKIYHITEEKTCPICEHNAKQKAKTQKPYHPRPETAINFLMNISPEMTITINEIDTAIADPALKYELMNRIYEKIMESQEPNILWELADTW